MIITLFQVNDKDKKSRFFEEIFLLANISIDIVFKMFFLILNNDEVKFNNPKLRWKLYTATKHFLAQSK